MGCCRVFLIPAMIFGFAAPVLAADAPAAKAVTPVPAPIAIVVDVQKVLDESTAAKSVRKQVESLSTKFQAEIGKEETELSQAERELNKSRETLSGDAYADREQQYRQRLLSVERDVQARRRVLDQALNDSMGVVRSTLLEVVNAVAHEHGANLVLNKQQVLWTDISIDMTNEVLTRLNTRLPDLAVKMAPVQKPADMPK